MFKITKHASQRLNQRGIKKTAFKLFLQIADREVSVGSGDYALSISKKQSIKLANLGFERDLVDKVAKLTVVCSSDGFIKTCMIMFDGKAKPYLNENHGKWRRKAKRPSNDNLSQNSSEWGL
jgi:hypothetical protein